MYGAKLPYTNSYYRYDVPISVTVVKNALLRTFVTIHTHAHTFINSRISISESDVPRIIILLSSGYLRVVI